MSTETQIMSPSTRRTVLIAASGTGGHLLPAVYIAEALKALEPDLRIVFVGSGRPLEAKIIDERGYERVVIDITGVRRTGLQGIFRLAASLPSAVLATYRILNTFRPSLVLGVGGYVTVLPVLLASLQGVPTWIHEAEHEAGWANKLLAYFATKISLAWPNAKIPCSSKTLVTGQPLRPELAAANFTKSALSKPPHLLVLGGSQGAKALDEGMASLAPWLAAEGIALRHQGRIEQQESLMRIYAKAKVDAQVLPFIEDMVEALQWSDIIISRAGAGAVRDIEISGRPAVLVPLPNSKEQQDNAEALAARGLIVTVLEGAQFSERLQQAIETLLRSSETQGVSLPGRKSNDGAAAKKIAEGCRALML